MRFLDWPQKAYEFVALDLKWTLPQEIALNLTTPITESLDVIEHEWNSQPAQQNGSTTEKI